MIMTRNRIRAPRTSIEKHAAAMKARNTELRRALARELCDARRELAEDWKRYEHSRQFHLDRAIYSSFGCCSLALRAGVISSDEFSRLWKWVSSWRDIYREGRA